LRKSREDKFRSEIQRDFAILVKEKKLLSQIKDIGESQFGKLADKKRYETLRLDSVQGLLLNYAVSTGQNPAALPIYQKFYGSGAAAQKISLDQSSVKGFAAGGFVGAPDIGRDYVPALLRGREYILNPEAVRSIGVSNLDRLNSGGGAAGGINVNLNYSPTIIAQNAAQLEKQLDAGKRKVMDLFYKTLKGDYRRTEMRDLLTT
jgi:hypothetical protein